MPELGMGCKHEPADSHHLDELELGWSANARRYVLVLQKVGGLRRSLVKMIRLRSQPSAFRIWVRSI
jgi:hypothetical protein